METSMREVTEQDLPAVVTVHKAAFPDSLLSRLGSKVVSRYYAWQLSEANEAVGVAVVTDDELLGFALGGIFRDSLNGFFKSNRRLIAGALLRRPWLVADPLLWNRWEMLVASLRRARRRANQAAPAGPSSEPSKPRARKRYVVLSIGTHPRHRRKGVAATLLAFHESRARRLGHDTIFLSVRADNEGALSLYRSRGWIIYQELEKPPTSKMKKELHPE